jgi:hypothetical protein
MKCSMCGIVWRTADDFFNDLQVSLLGYQDSPSSARDGLFLFVHERAGCLTTLSLRATTLIVLAPEPFRSILGHLLERVPERMAS